MKICTDKFDLVCVYLDTIEIHKDFNYNQEQNQTFLKSQNQIYLHNFKELYFKLAGK